MTQFFSTFQCVMEIWKNMENLNHSFFNKKVFWKTFKRKIHDIFFDSFYLHFELKKNLIDIKMVSAKTYSFRKYFLISKQFVYNKKFTPLSKEKFRREEKLKKVEKFMWNLKYYNFSTKSLFRKEYRLWNSWDSFWRFSFIRKRLLNFHSW